MSMLLSNGEEGRTTREDPLRPLSHVNNIWLITIETNILLEEQLLDMVQRAKSSPESATVIALEMCVGQETRTLLTCVEGSIWKEGSGIVDRPGVAA